jgi:hypothetical protein
MPTPTATASVTSGRCSTALERRRSASLASFAASSLMECAPPRNRLAMLLNTGAMAAATRSTTSAVLADVPTRSSCCSSDRNVAVSKRGRYAAGGGGGGLGGLGGGGFGGLGGSMDNPFQLWPPRRRHMDDDGDLHEQILHIEAHIEELADVIERCRKIILIQKPPLLPGEP